MSEHFYDYDPSAALDNDEAIAVFLADALESGDDAYIAKAMSIIAQAKGMTRLAPEDHQAFFEALDNPPAPTEKLRVAFNRHRETLKS
jgi:probable addiction module antidote protein